MYCLVASGCGLALECDPEKADWPLLELTYVNNLTHVEASNMNCRRYQTSDPHRPHPFGRLLHAACENHSFPKWAELNGSKSRLKLRNQVVGQHVANSDHVVLSVITLKKDKNDKNSQKEFEPLLELLSGHLPAITLGCGHMLHRRTPN